jgi:Tfp pilus assembly protein PilF
MRAEALLKRAVLTADKLRDPKTLCANFADALSSLATVYSYLDDQANAQKAYDRVLAHEEEFLGPDHPRLTAALSGLGLLLIAQGKAKKARTLLERALKIDEKTFGAHHVEVATSLGMLAATGMCRHCCAAWR